MATDFIRPPRVWTGDDWALRYEAALKRIVEHPARAVVIAREALCLPPAPENSEPLSDTTAIFREEGGRIISGEVGK